MTWRSSGRTPTPSSILTRRCRPEWPPGGSRLGPTAPPPSAPLCRRAGGRPPGRTCGPGRSRPEPGSRSASIRSQSGPRTYEEPEEEAPARRNKGLFVAIGVGAVAGVVALVVLVVLVTKGSGTAMVEVPSFVGQVFKEIDPEKYPKLRLIDGDYLYSNEYEAGEVISQDPVARTQVAEGSTVKLIISNGPQTGQMGDLVNRTKEKAQEYLNGLKDLKLSVVLEEEFSSDVAAGRVTRTDPEADEILTVGQTVTLWISKGSADGVHGRPHRPAPDQCRGAAPEPDRYESEHPGGGGSQRDGGRR